MLDPLSAFIRFRYTLLCMLITIGTSTQAFNDLLQALGLHAQRTDNFTQPDAPPSY